MPDPRRTPSGWLPQSLMAILTFLYLLQFVLWIRKEDNWWLPETALVVTLTLIIMLTIYMVPKLGLTFRNAIQLILTGIMLIWLTMGLFEKYDLPAYWTLSVKLAYIQFYFLLWFVLATWWVFNIVMWMTKSKFTIGLLAFIGILIFGIRDSFSNLYLWKHVGVLLFCVLSMLVIRHLHEFKKRAPESWKQLKRSPGPVIVPFLILLILSLTIGTLAPSINPVLTDPYTVWKRYKGEAVSAFGNPEDQSNLSPETPLSNVLSSVSGYSRDDSKLGGSFRFDYTPIMTVQTNYRGYWRGETRSLYNGEGWEKDPIEQKALLTDVSKNTTLAKDPKWDMSKLKTREVTQTVTMLNNTTYPVLFAAYRPVKVVSMESPFSFIKWSANQSELRMKQDEIYPSTYEIVSEVPLLDVDGLRQVDFEQLNPNTVSNYLQLPSGLPGRVKQLALDITKNEPNIYDKVKRIEQYLSTTYPYTNTPNENKRQSNDFVDGFLFEVKEGYCDYFSSSMVVLTRSLGIPARWVKGYASGTNPSQMNTDDGVRFRMDSNAAGEYTVRNSDAHSWVEVYFPGYGWIPFEPTSGFTFPYSAAPEESPKEAQATSAPLPTPQPVQNSSKNYSAVYVTLGILAGAVAASYLFILLGGPNWVKRKLNPMYGASADQKLIHDIHKLMKLYKKKGYRHEPYETIRETVKRWGEEEPEMKPYWDSLLTLFEKATYSPHQLNRVDEEKAHANIQKLYAYIKSRKRG